MPVEKTPVPTGSRSRGTPDSDAPARLPRHLMDPDNLPARRGAGSSKSLTQVQRWVMSSLAVVTILHLSATFVFAAVISDPGKIDARIGLNVIAGALGTVAVAAFRAIHGKPLVSPWLLLGTVPGLVGAWLTFSL